ncbi:unnamed protein product [Hymenolepis diminuta]|uniref:RRM domain-containing protein n=1 Tax=Hymenolepis diminuta TaxID=6216 RepID=A0A0R3SQN1_HYMDI|nr:unnamed protein product [Hymenolepis diminuta]
MFGVSNVTNRMDPNSLRSRLFVGNLNTLHMQKPELEAIFQQYGKIIGLSVHKGYAFIQYANEMSARAALNGEDEKVYFNMILDVSLASEPKTRKRGRSYTGSLLCSDQPNLVDLAFQSQAALAAIGGQFSQLGFLPQQQNSHQYRSPSFNLPGIIGAPLLSSAPKFHRTSPPNHVSSTSQQKNRTFVTPQSVNTASTPKRTRLENPASSNFFGSRLPSVDSPKSPKSPISLDPSSSNPNSKSLESPGSSDSVISDKLSGMTVDNGLDLQSFLRSSVTIDRNSVIDFNEYSAVQIPCIFHGPISQIASSESEESLTPHETSRNRETRLPVPTTTTPEQTNQPIPSSSSNPNLEDILICGRCRRLFDTIDDLLSHKTKNSCVIEVKNSGSEHSCRCKALGEPESLGCLFCSEKLLSSWELLEHCRLKHNLTVYRVPKRCKSGFCSTSERKTPTITPISDQGSSKKKEEYDLEKKPSGSQKSLEKESKCQDALFESVEIVDSPDPSNKVITISSDEENVGVDSEGRQTE